MKLEKLSLKLLIGLLSISVMFNCSKKEDDVLDEPQIIEQPQPVTLNNEINDFIWKGLNEIYLWQGDVPNLADNKFSNQDEYYTFLNTYNTPEGLFDGLLYQKGVVDKFSYLVDDYIALENSLQGNSNSSGLDFRLERISGSDYVFGYVRYTAKDSDAASKDIRRGDFFLSVNGQQLTINNYFDLLFGSNNTYTLGMADITNNTIALNGKTVELTKTSFTENPILINKVIDADGIKVGYLMYNQFISNFDTALNDAISQLKSQSITELVLDLRYNPGGVVSSAIILSGMITGQFTGKIFSREIWNNRYQQYFEANNPEYLINRFTDKLLDNSPMTMLKLNKVYILTTSGSASASELVINCLEPYIDVVQIGATTTGKYTASVTLYDSPNFGKDNANPSHKYAMQPLVFKSTNAIGVTDYYNGIIPDYSITYQSASGSVFEGENITALGVLGDVNEPFLAKAISLITGKTSKFKDTKNEKRILGFDFEEIADSKDFAPLGKNMFIKLKHKE
ncbi:S41 family peptidase [Gaetbulibacter aquiaggeris]|uniref:S41 family peptidase n=1 Tax=Gaetbulibacter aquiaggeris TaxID=1735373 RepID=A0ABW7MT64_9FLAO